MLGQMLIIGAVVGIVGIYYVIALVGIARFRLNGMSGSATIAIVIIAAMIAAAAAVALVPMVAAMINRPQWQASALLQWILSGMFLAPFGLRMLGPASVARLPQPPRGRQSIGRTVKRTYEWTAQQ